MFPTRLHISVILALLALVAAGLYFVLIKQNGDPDTSTVRSFEECVAAGYPVMESYPRQCRNADGTLFVEEVDEPVAESFGSIQGTVLLGPTCPVVQDPPDPECDDRPYETNLVLTNADGSRVIREFASKSDGTFLIDVPAGSYAIRSAAVANILPYCSSTGVIQVPVNDTVKADVFCDTGIR
jgi:hypothetical protein